MFNSSVVFMELHILSLITFQNVSPYIFLSTCALESCNIKHFLFSVIGSNFCKETIFCLQYYFNS